MFLNHSQDFNALTFFGLLHKTLYKTSCVYLSVDVRPLDLMFGFYVWALRSNNCLAISKTVELSLAGCNCLTTQIGVLETNKSIDLKITPKILLSQTNS
ncbi:hypothetical protein [cyanobacterium endosymbiont of Rhopalodia gibberula]|uniref:hypothetical protein n=1 Tax=cyanobacterium endosymbiont of Rhopalodia gibberula TaxID=1763363 RepID=UPI0015585884|nr:hypothetical protein [cyanobacterium endosymbiont of Rhopalodia gibberula]